MLGNVRFKQNPLKFLEEILKGFARLDNTAAFRNHATSKVHVNGLAALKLNGCTLRRTFWCLFNIYELATRGGSHHGEVHFGAFWTGDSHGATLFHRFFRLFFLPTTIFFLALQQFTFLLGQLNGRDGFVVIPGVPIIIVIVLFRRSRLNGLGVDVVPLLFDWLRGLWSWVLLIEQRLCFL